MDDYQGAWVLVDPGFASCLGCSFLWVVILVAVRAPDTLLRVPFFYQREHTQAFTLNSNPPPPFRTVAASLLAQVRS